MLGNISLEGSLLEIISISVRLIKLLSHKHDKEYIDGCRVLSESFILLLTHLSLASFKVGHRQTV